MIIIEDRILFLKILYFLWFLWDFLKFEGMCECQKLTEGCHTAYCIYALNLCDVKLRAELFLLLTVSDCSFVKQNRFYTLALRSECLPPIIVNCLVVSKFHFYFLFFKFQFRGLLYIMKEFVWCSDYKLYEL